MTKLKDLCPEQRAKFYRFIDRAVAKNLTANQVQDLLAKELGKAFGERMIQRYMEKRRNQSPIRLSELESAAGDTVQEIGTGSDSKEVWLESQRVVTLEDALTKGNVDLTQWDVERYVVNSWEVGAKGPDKRIRVTPLWQVKVWLKAKKGWNTSEFRKLLVQDLKALAPSYAKLDYQPGAPILAELSVFDAHFGKLAWAPETGQDYDIKICQKRYMDANRALLRRASMFHPERILIVLGNDFFHADHKNETTSGTAVDCDGRWQKAFRIGKGCCITIAEEASQIAPVDLLIVPGNHDREKAFCLGEVLDARFHLNHDVNVMNDPDPFSYYRWGKTLLGFNHGEGYTGDKKRAELPTQMSTDRAVDWSETVWREWHLGHFHSEDELVWRYRKVQQIRDITVRVLPSLSSTDGWHRQNGYASPLAAECHLYHKNHGRWCYLVHQTTG